MFAGNRKLGADILQWMISKGHSPGLVVLPKDDSDPGARAIESLCLTDNAIKVARPGPRLQDELLAHVTEYPTDYLLSIHYPCLLPGLIFQHLRVGAINLHPSLLPYNRGWHTPSWSILDGTPAGATLHFMTDRVDAGDIISQVEVEVRSSDTAHSLYLRILNAEFRLFQDSFSQLLSLNPSRIAQDEHLATFHRKSDLLDPQVNLVDDFSSMGIGEFWNRVRALTTSQSDEALRVRFAGQNYRVRVEIERENSTDWTQRSSTS